MAIAGTVSMGGRSFGRTQIVQLAVAVALLWSPLRVLVPFAAGIVAWWCLPGERKAERLVVFGSIAGLSTFWLLFRALAPRIGPAAAALSAAAAMAAAGIGLLSMRAGKPANHVGRELRGARLAALVVAALIAGVSTYAASGRLLAFNEAVELHIPLVASLQRGNWPPIDLREPPHAMEYHWGLHALAAGLATLARTDTSHLALFATNSVAAALAFCAVFLVVSRHAGFSGGLLGAILFFGGGTLNWTSLPRFVEPASYTALLNPLFMPFTSGNLIVGGFFWRVHSNSMSWAVCCLLLAIELWSLARDHRPRASAVAAGVALALVAPTNETMFCGGLVGLVGIAVMRTWADRSPAPFRFGVVLAAVAVVLVPLLGGVLDTLFSVGNTQQQWKLELNQAHFGDVPSFNFGSYFGDRAWMPLLSKRFFQDAGPLPTLMIPAGLLAVRRRAWPIVAMACAGLSLLGATTTITLVRYPADVFRMLSTAVSFGGLVCGYAAAVLVSMVRPAPVRALAWIGTIAAVVCLAAAWPLSWVGLTCCGQPSPWPQANGGPMIDGAAVAWLKQNSEFRDAVLTLPPGRPEIAPSGQVYPKGNYLGARLEYPERAAAALARPDIDALRNMGVRYLYVLENLITADQRAELRTAVRQRRVSRVWGDPILRGSVLLRIEPPHEPP